MQHPAVPEELRGTYAGLAHPAVIEHLTSLGVTAVELMPVHQFVNDPSLVEQGPVATTGATTPSGSSRRTTRYAAFRTPGSRCRSSRRWSRRCTQADIEVILDVVYNHTAEGNHMGPTLSFRGIDNANYYRLVDDDQAHYFDTTGTGNSLLMRSPHVLQLIMDSLRYWVTEMHVDGFRFDLAATLARQFHEVDRLSAFFDLVHQDPVVSQVKLIAEPWDVGDGGYQVGGFPPLWSEWNGKYRDTVRDFWRGEPSTLGEFASRLSGSSDLYEHTGRRPIASVNFVTAHDGFTLNDLVSYNEKHNEANGEGNNDGESHNRSWNCGVEGPTDDPTISALRARQRRNFLTTLLLSQGVPMIAHGDELGRTQQGNNNVYCQDSPISWIDWDLDEDETDAAGVHAPRRAAAAGPSRVPAPSLLRRRARPRRTSPTCSTSPGSRRTGTTCATRRGHADHARAVMVFLNGDAIAEPDLRGQEIVDDSFLVLFNGQPRRRDVHAPRRRLRRRRGPRSWTRTRRSRPATTVEAGTTLDLAREVDHRAHPAARSRRRRRRPASARSPTAATRGGQADEAGTRARGEAADEKPKRRTTQPRPSA